MPLDGVRHHCSIRIPSRNSDKKEGKQFVKEESRSSTNFMSQLIVQALPGTQKLPSIRDLVMFKIPFGFRKNGPRTLLVHLFFYMSPRCGIYTRH